YAATGRPPFGGGRIEAIIHRTLDGEIDLDGADPRVADLVRLCAAKDPASRVRPERLIEMTASPVALAADPGYRRLVGAPPPVPASLPDAVASGLVPPARLKAGGRRPNIRAREAVAALLAVAVLLTVLVARSLTDGPDGSEQGGAQAARTGPADGGAANATGEPPAGRSPGPGGRPPVEILVKQPTADFRSMEFSQDRKSTRLN